MNRLYRTLSLLLILTLSVSVFSFTSQAAGTPRYLDSVYGIYEMSPYSIRQTFEQTGWDMQLTSSTWLDDVYGSDEGSIAGVTIYDSRTIYLSDSGNLAYMAANHEMGHYFDYVYGLVYGMMPSQTDDFKYIYEQEGYADDYYEDYIVNSRLEYFAQSYKFFCEDMGALKNRPLTYTYMLSLVQNFDDIFNKGFTVTENLSILPKELLPVRPISTYDLPPLVEVKPAFYEVYSAKDIKVVAPFRVSEK